MAETDRANRAGVSEDGIEGPTWATMLLIYSMQQGFASSDPAMKDPRQAKGSRLRLLSAKPFKTF